MSIEGTSQSSYFPKNPSMEEVISTFGKRVNITKGEADTLYAEGETVKLLAMEAILKPNSNLQVSRDTIKMMAPYAFRGNMQNRNTGGYRLTITFNKLDTPQQVEPTLEKKTELDDKQQKP